MTPSLSARHCGGLGGTGAFHIRIGGGTMSSVSSQRRSLRALVGLFATPESLVAGGSKPKGFRCSSQKPKNSKSGSEWNVLLNSYSRTLLMFAGHVPRVVFQDQAF